MDAVTTKTPRQLPNELWMAIAEFIEPDELVRYMGAHRVFYEQVMDLRYQELELRDLRPSRLFQVVENLKFPAAAGRVRTLTIWPIALQTAIHNIPVLPERPISLLREIIQLLRRIRSQRRIPTSIQTRDREIKKRYRSVKDAGEGLTNVESVNLRWDGPDRFDEPLFDAIRPLFGSNLRVLCLDIPLMTFAEACVRLTGLKDLEELELALHIDPARAVPKEDLRKAVTSALVPFLIQVGPSLRILSMAIKDHLELAPFFDGLGKFPKLDRLMLNIPFDLHHIDEPSGFNRLLVDHPDLKELYIMHHSCCKTHQPPMEPVGKEWVRGCFQGVAFRDLKTLSLKLTKAFHLKFVEAMTPLAQSLSSLILTEPSLKYADVANILTSLSTPRLNSLTLFVETLTPQLVALLAERCPSLDRLDLEITQCRKAEGAQGPHDEPGFIRGLETDYVFRHTLYAAWKLRRLTIRMWVHTLGKREQPTLINAITAKIPALGDPT